ncbi:DUF6197 family protein [Streptomyces sp. 8L]|uniref:DUF6197 family protein n=1 Tax=Streptomyces sp. 8L TaxID=2877242 RepID=UPI001CD27AEC|nr:hypothetical protein [Streptomyces sp. 8L]MCA1218482.1 hypothetical protein [Streptomyces sp. 8L]
MSFSSDLVLKARLDARDAQIMTRDVDSYLAAAAAPTLTPEAVAEWVERAWRLAPRGDWLAWGSSGTPLSGQVIAAHARAAADILRTAGWNPDVVAGRGLRDALVYAERLDVDGGFSMDTRMAVGEIVGLLVRAATGAPHVYYEMWDAHPSRTVQDVLQILDVAAAFALTYTPGTVSSGQAA